MSDEKQETIADIAAEMRLKAEHFEKASSLMVSESALALFLYPLIDRIEAAARRAYNQIDSAVCGIEAATSSDIDDVRKAMDETIGDYYE